MENENNVISLAENTIKVKMDRLLVAANSGAIRELASARGLDGKTSLALVRLVKKIDEELTDFNKIIHEKRAEMAEVNTEEGNKEFMDLYNSLIAEDVVFAGKKINFSSIQDCKMSMIEEGVVKWITPSAAMLISLDWLIDLEA